MKFGKSIGSQRDGNVDLHYVDYKLLKKRIRDVVEQLHAHELNKALRANSEFDAELEAEIEQVNACFAQKQQQLLEQTGNLSEELQASQALEASQASQAAAQPDQAAGSSPADRAVAAVAQRPEAFRRLVDILEEVDQLRKYAVWNAVAVVKILKKRQKQTHFGLEDTAAERAAWLSRQSFFSGSDIAELHAAIESLGHMLVLSELMPDSSARRPQSQENEPQQCPICLDTISDMVELSCNHRFCWKCFVLGPIAFQPGEYRITQCPICRTETAPEPRSSLSADVLGVPSSEGILTRFLRTYFPKEGFGKEADEEQASEQEVRDVVGELVKALLADNTLPRPSKGKSEPQDAASGSGARGSAAALDFFQTLPPQKTPEEKQLIGAAQKLRWLQLASSGDAFALDGAMYCSLCSEPLLMEAVLSTPCKHHFHRVCVSRLEEPKCPLCGFQLPFSWFIPADHPCAEDGFTVVPNHAYRPLFPGGPSRGSHGYPLHRPPPVSLLGPSGLKMKSYLHKIVPMGQDEEAACPSSPSASGLVPETASHREEAEDSSVSDSSSEDSNSEDEHQPREHGVQGAQRKPRWAYSAIGRMRLVEWSDTGTAATPAPPEVATAPVAEAAGSSCAAGSAGPASSASSMAAAASAEPAEQRNAPVLLIRKHL